MTKSSAFNISLDLTPAQASAVASLIENTPKPTRILTRVRDQILLAQGKAQQATRTAENIENADTLVNELIDDVIELYSTNIKKRGLTSSAMTFGKGLRSAFSAADKRAVKSGLSIGDDGFIEKVIRPLVARVEKISHIYSESEDKVLEVSDNYTHAKQRQTMAKHTTRASIEALMGLTDYLSPASRLDKMMHRCNDVLTMLSASRAMLSGNPRTLAIALNRIYEYERTYDMLPTTYWNFIDNHSYKIARK